jgi:hypothetical protein
MHGLRCLPSFLRGEALRDEAGSLSRKKIEKQPHAKWKHGCLAHCLPIARNHLARRGKSAATGDHRTIRSEGLSPWRRSRHWPETSPDMATFVPSIIAKPPEAQQLDENYVI